jgi:hypothetical protein
MAQANAFERAPKRLEAQGERRAILVETLKAKAEKLKALAARLEARIEPECSCAANVFRNELTVFERQYLLKGHAGDAGNGHSIDQHYFTGRNLRAIREAIRQCDLQRGSVGKIALYVMALRRVCEWEFPQLRPGSVLQRGLCGCPLQMFDVERNSEFARLMHGDQEWGATETKRAVKLFSYMIRDTRETCQSR